MDCFGIPVEQMPLATLTTTTTIASKHKMWVLEALALRASFKTYQSRGYMAKKKNHKLLLLAMG